MFSIKIQNWVKTAPLLVERGRWFHRQLESEFERLGRAHIAHADDPEHDRYVGAAVEMLSAAQIYKAVNFYNRWAVMAGYQALALVSADPIVVDIGDAKARVSGPYEFEVI